MAGFDPDCEPEVNPFAPFLSDGDIGACVIVGVALGVWVWLWPLFLRMERDGP